MEVRALHPRFAHGSGIGSIGDGRQRLASEEEEGDTAGQEEGGDRVDRAVPGADPRLTGRRRGERGGSPIDGSGGSSPGIWQGRSGHGRGRYAGWEFAVPRPAGGWGAQR